MSDFPGIQSHDTHYDHVVPADDPRKELRFIKDEREFELRSATSSRDDAREKLEAALERAAGEEDEVREKRRKTEVFQRKQELEVKVKERHERLRQYGACVGDERVLELLDKGDSKRLDEGGRGFWIPHMDPSSTSPRSRSRR